MALLLSSLRANDKEKALIFILEEADLFCTHHNQSLLYNLFDLAHRNEVNILICHPYPIFNLLPRSKNSVFVLGVTLRFDVVDRMEKRVRSRFSSRFIHLLPCSDANDFGEKISLCSDLLHLDTGSMDQNFCKAWNQSVDALLAKDAPGYCCIKRLYDMENSEDSFKEYLVSSKNNFQCLFSCLYTQFHLITNASDDKPQLTGEDFEKAFEIFTSDGWLQKLDGLSILELCLVIKLQTIYQISF
jgi:origin recognition complex subunit 4